MSFDAQIVDAAVAVYGEDAREFIQLTLNDADNFMESIAGLIPKGDVAAVSLAAHSLKSILRQVGALHAGAAAYEIEKAGKNGNISECQALFGPLSDAYTEARSYLASLL